MKMTISSEDKEGKVNFLYCAAWHDTKPELNTEQAYKLFRALGWKPTWAKWYRRAWWWLKAKLRCLNRAS